MATTHTYTILNKYIEVDALVTDVEIQFSGDITETVNTSIYHFQPQSVEEVEANIENRIITELNKIIARNVMQQIITEL
jgi:hypothetical protein